MLRVGGQGDSSSAQCQETRRSVTSTMTTLNGSPVITRSFMQFTVKLSVTESELDSTVSTAQDMIFVKDIVESMELEVEVSMILKTDNK